MFIGQACLTDVLLINSAIEDPRFVLMSRTHAWFEDLPERFLRYQTTAHILDEVFFIYPLFHYK